MVVVLAGSLGVLASACKPGPIQQDSRADERPGRVDTLDGDSLTLEGNCDDDCVISYVITVPEAVSVTARLGSGDVTLDQVADVAVRTGSGEIRIANPEGDVTAAAGYGDISMRRCRTRGGPGWLGKRLPQQSLRSHPRRCWLG